MKEEVYAIKKIMKEPGAGKKQHILMTNGQSEVYETENFEEVSRMVEILNSNTDSGWRYEIVTMKR
jgi:hypothetical protein